MIFWSVKKNYYWSNDFSNDQKFWNQKSNLFSLFSWNDRYREYRIHFFERSIDELITFVTFWSVKKNYLSLVEWFFKNFENLTYSLCFRETIDIASIEYVFSKDRSMNITKRPIFVCERNCESLFRLLLAKRFFESKSFEIGTFNLFSIDHDRYHGIEYIYREIDRWM